MGEDVFCRKCLKPCIGEALKYNDQFFHSDCLACRLCGHGLNSEPFFAYEDHYYCIGDYQKQYGKKCSVCLQYLEGEVITIHGNDYHEACFACSRCKRPFPPGEKVTYDGKDYTCEKCVDVPKTSISPVPLHMCAGCNEVIKGSQALLALEKQWHLWCFTCSRCHCLLSGEYMGRDGKPYCEKDYQELFGVTCAGCGGYITGKVLQAGEKHYHPQCSRCARCKDIFGEGEEMYLQGNEIWHPRCSDEAALEEKMQQENNFPHPPADMLITPQTAAKAASAPLPPARTAASRDWKVPAEEQPPRDPKPRPYSYHEFASAARNYEPGSERSSGGAVYRSDISVPLDLKTKNATPRVRRYSTEDKDSKYILGRDSSAHDTSMSPNSGSPVPFQYYPYVELMTSNYKLPKGVDKRMLEVYLADEDFQKVFSMPRGEFAGLPTWKQNQFKKKALLF